MIYQAWCIIILLLFFSDPSFIREQAPWFKLHVNHDQQQDEHFSVHSLEEGFQYLGENADTQSGGDSADQFAYSAGDYHQEGVDNVGLSHIGYYVADQCHGATCQSGETSADEERERIYATGIDTQAGAHVTVLCNGPDLHTEAGTEQHTV